MNWLRYAIQLAVTDHPVTFVLYIMFQGALVGYAMGIGVCLLARSHLRQQMENHRGR